MYSLVQRLAEADSSFTAANGQNFDVEQGAEIGLSEFSGGFDLLFHDVILLGGLVFAVEWERMWIELCHWHLEKSKWKLKLWLD